MSAIDKAIASVTPPVSPEKRAEAHAEARAAATPGDWLSLILDHHEMIERAFETLKSATTVETRRAAEKRLGTLLTGHSMAEEAVVYPALAHAGHKISADMAYAEQVAAKMQMAALERMDPFSQDYIDKLGHLEGAVLTHVYEEEKMRFVQLREDAPVADQQMVTARYKEEFERYMGSDSGEDRASATAIAGAEARSFAPGPG